MQLLLLRNPNKWKSLGIGLVEVKIVLRETITLDCLPVTEAEQQKARVCASRLVYGARTGAAPSDSHTRGDTPANSASACQCRKAVGNLQRVFPHARLELTRSLRLSQPSGSKGQWREARAHSDNRKKAEDLSRKQKV